jgi:hypothetical protein
VIVDSWIVYSNRNQCGELPSSELVIRRIKEYRDKGVIPLDGMSSPSGGT